ncbi:hypothetical protein MPDQ_001442 [Monascus purpureus]|uniref:Major facilitator superfamily (MFS) profile domain-containing protein n=1 Tax=Monascus purpureus TaxID=5098 RepID=A0A507R321_MONPU|nr:hypothetical protein MPDQ_001442 [Monascus purpureus]
MADDHLSRIPTARSAGSRRSTSTLETLSHIYSGRYVDDAGVYMNEGELEEMAEEEEENERRLSQRLSGKPTLEGKGEAHFDAESSSRESEGTGHHDDIEKGGLGRPKTREAETGQDPKLVTWEGPDDPENPKNWTLRKKWAATVIVSCFTFISPVSSSMVAPALSTISKQFHITDEVESQLTMSVFVLAYAIGPLFLGPMSEIYGRVIVLQAANLFYLVFNVACGVAQSKGQMIAFRFLSGLGGSASLAIGGGVLSDCFIPEERGKAISMYSLAPLLGPAVGPIAGGFITENTTWRWVFYATTIVDGAIQVLGLFLLRETYAPVILKTKAKKLRKSTGDPDYKTAEERADKTLVKLLRVSLVRPFRLLATQPIIQALACYMAYVYGLMYLMLSTFPELWTNPKYYHESIGIGGLNYISLGLGFTLGTQISAPLNDRIYRILKKKNNGVGQPEYRVPLLFAACLFIPAGLFIYGWTAQKHCHWIVPNIGACIYGIGNIITFLCIQTYLIDTYTRFAASALAACAFLRSLAGFGFPLFAPYMFQALDYGWGNSLLAFVAIGIGVPAPIIMWRLGPKLRKLSTYAAG